jgi:ABC-2 type transport system ATP-binding protein
MRCEIAASLLHAPRILFLDEPTIGLDVVVKHHIRQLILRLNEEEQVTVFLTSHDAGDVEQLCRRAMVINHGQVIYDGKVSTLKRNYIRSKAISLKLEEPFQGFERVGVKVVKAAGTGVKLEVDTNLAQIDRVVASLMSRYTILDMTVEDPPMEQVIAHIYEAAGSAVPGE